jgi:hypothetical protein
VAFGLAGFFIPGALAEVLDDPYIPDARIAIAWIT